MTVPKNVWWFELLLYASLTLDALSVAFQDRTPRADMTEQMISVATIFRHGLLIAGGHAALCPPYGPRNPVNSSHGMDRRRHRAGRAAAWRILRHRRVADARARPAPRPRPRRRQQAHAPDAAARQQRHRRLARAAR